MHNQKSEIITVFLLKIKIKIDIPKPTADKHQIFDKLNEPNKPVKTMCTKIFNQVIAHHVFQNISTMHFYPSIHLLLAPINQITQHH